MIGPGAVWATRHIAGPNQRAASSLPLTWWRPMASADSIYTPRRRAAVKTVSPHGRIQSHEALLGRGLEDIDEPLHDLYGVTRDRPASAATDSTRSMASRADEAAVGIGRASTFAQPRTARPKARMVSISSPTIGPSPVLEGWTPAGLRSSRPSGRCRPRRARGRSGSSRPQSGYRPSTART